VISPGLTAQIRNGQTTYLNTMGTMTQEQKDALLAFEQKRAAALGYVPPDPPVSDVLADTYRRAGMEGRRPVKPTATPAEPNRSREVGREGRRG
jgi:phosphoribosylamine-glycine ligase